MKKLKEEWGGYREGSGRKPSDEPKKIVSLLLSIKSVQKIEKLRKEKNRSQFVDDLIKEL